MSASNSYDPNRKWIIEVTEAQLYDIINDVEDTHRFLAGQTELINATSYIEPCKSMHEARHCLSELKQFVTPELEKGASYGWNGGSCPNKWQKSKIARDYAIYRNLRHCLEMFYNSDSWNVYKSETLSCGVPLAVCYPKPSKNGQDEVDVEAKSSPGQMDKQLNQ